MIFNKLNLPSIEALQLWEKVVSFSNNGVIVVAAQEKELSIIYVNPAFEEKTSYSLTEVKGKNPRFLHNDDVDQPGLWEIRQALKEQKSCNVTVRNYRKDSTLFWNELFIYPIFDTLGNLTYYIGIQNYITARKMAEDEVLKLNTELEQRVNQRTAELAQANHILTEQISCREQLEVELRDSLEKEKELVKLKSRFLAMTSHEFRTPLSVILSYSELLEYYGEHWTKEKRILSLQNIQREVMRLTNILGDILVVGKAEAGGLGFDPIPHNLNSICEEIIIELKLSNQSLSEINFIDNFEPTFVMVDEKLLRHILINLLSNAIKYSEDGSPVYLTLSKQGEKIVIEVKDHGIGIPQEDQNCIFEPFTRATNVATINGTGLGLTIVKKSVELHGGEISFISKPGEGTIFTVTLDLKLC